MAKILIVFGTRPEAIKMCPLIKELKTRKGIELKVCVTGQHKEMLYEVLDRFKIVPDYNLEIMMPNQTLFDITNRTLERIKPILEKENPDIVLVHGDTSTAFCTALACFYLNIKVGHIEAGLRTYNLNSPFPEEFNRQAISLIAEFNFAPTNLSMQNLIREGKSQNSIYVTGNTGLDALRLNISNDYNHPILKWAQGSRLILLTAHRRENSGEPFKHIFKAVKRLVENFSDIKVVYPMHKNPAVRILAEEILSNSDRIKLIEPLDPYNFQNIMANSYLILTDSGGIQEEAPSLGKPVLVMRDTTERIEGLEAGTLKLAGTEEVQIYNMAVELLSNKKEYEKMSKSINPYGDGYSSEKIADILCNSLYKKN